VYNIKVPKIIINPTLNPNLDKKKSKAPILRPYYRPFFFLAVPLSIINIVLSILFFAFLPPEIPIFHTMIQPDDRLADSMMIFILPILATIINVIHALVIYFGRKYELLLLNIFSYFTIFIQLLLLAVLLRTVLVII